MTPVDAHDFIALTHLTKGDRTTDRKHFQQAVEKGVFFSYLYELSWMLLERMERDKSWAAW